MRFIERFKASPALVVASLALLVAMTGTSVAAVQQVLPRNSVGAKHVKRNAIGAKHVKRAAITSKEVRNRSLTRADFRRGTLLRGVRGLRGPAGPAGAAGARGPSDVRQIADGNATAWSASFATQRSLSLPVGSWLVTATLGVDSNGAAGTTQTCTCRLAVGGTVVDQVELVLGGNATVNEKAAITLQGGRAITAAGNADLQCQSSGAGSVTNASISAIQVTTLTNA
jgi:hypothetical protein